jgi:hypothetical protein
MHEGLPVFTAWSSFYVITGSSAAALTGLMFVVVTLVAGRGWQPSVDPSEGFATFSTPTVFHFAAAFLVSGILSAPWQSILYAGAVIALVGLAGFAYMLRVMARTKRLTGYDVPPEDWLWYGMLPLIAYVAIAAAGILFFSVASTVGLFLLAAATLLLIFIGIHNAWDTVTYITAEQIRDR